MIKTIPANLVRIINILNDGKYHNGNTLGKDLQMTRSAVWKIIKKLRHYSIKIDSHKNKGYLLNEPLILLDASKIKSQLGDLPIEITIFDSIPSTNDYLKSSNVSKTIAICLAEQQTQGKGRLNRTWYSPFARNIYFSCLYPLQKDISELAGLSLVTSLAILKTLKSYSLNEHLFVKWPNDIIYANKKLSGSLIEVQAEAHGASHAIIGIGMNVNMLEDAGQISQSWTSLQKITGEYIDRNILCGRLLSHLFTYLQQFARQGFAYFADEWLQADCLTNVMVTVKNLEKTIQGKVTGINEQGHLLLKLANGTIQAFSSGDTSIMRENELQSIVYS